MDLQHLTVRLFAVLFSFSFPFPEFSLDVVGIRFGLRQEECICAGQRWGWWTRHVWCGQSQQLACPRNIAGWTKKLFRCRRWWG